MKRFGIPQLLGLYIASVLLWLIFTIACLFFGTTHLGWPVDAYTLKYREELTLTASLVGAALSVAGATYQAVLRNPLAEPYLLGVTAGATLAGYLWAFPTIALSPLLLPVSQQTAAFIGALLALLVVFSLAQRRGKLEPVTLLLVGVIVNAICSSIYLFVNHLNLRRDAAAGTGGVMRLLVGGINTNLTRGQCVSTAAIVTVGIVILAAIAGDLNIAKLSEGEARSLGIRVQRVRWLALLVASMITAAAVAISGPIAFIGLVCPHLGRLIVGQDQRRLLPVATAIGAGLLALADAVARAIAPVTLGQLPVGVLTGMLGGPFFLVMLWRTHRRERGQI